MNFVRISAAVVVATILWPHGALAQTATYSQVKQNSGDLTLKPYSELTGDRAKPSLINGVEVSPKAFMASFHAQSADGGLCTGTLVGPRVMLIAAHCMGDGKKMTIAIGGTTEYSATCTHDSSWKNGDLANGSDISADYALCLFGQDIPGRDPETLLLTTNALTKGKRVLLAGYGCRNTDFNDRRTGNDGAFHVGFSRVHQSVGAVNMACGGGVGPKVPNYVSTKSDPAKRDEAVVCPGDSGGGAYLLKDDKTVTGGRKIIAINSRVGYKLDANCNLIKTATGNPQAGDVSYLSATYTAKFKSFVEGWAKANKAGICGIDPSLKNACHP